MTLAQQLQSALKARRIESHTDHRRGYLTVTRLQHQLLGEIFDAAEEEAGPLGIALTIETVETTGLVLVCSQG